MKVTNPIWTDDHRLPDGTRVAQEVTLSPLSESMWAVQLEAYTFPAKGRPEALTVGVPIPDHLLADHFVKYVRGALQAAPLRRMIHPHLQERPMELSPPWEQVTMGREIGFMLASERVMVACLRFVAEASGVRWSLCGPTSYFGSFQTGVFEIGRHQPWSVIDSMPSPASMLAHEVDLTLHRAGFAALRPAEEADLVKRLGDWLVFNRYSKGGRDAQA